MQQTPLAYVLGNQTMTTNGDLQYHNFFFFI